MSVADSLWPALALAVGLAILHLLAPRIRRLPGVREAATASFAGGAAVAYVFLHLLPDLAEGSEAIGRALEDELSPAPLLDLGLFAVALAGFLAFYGLERLARRHGARAPGAGAPAGLFWLHLGSFALVNALITYTMPLRVRTGTEFAVLFSVAIGLHFVLTDRGLEAAYPDRFRASGRYVLAGALLLGWAAAAPAAPTGALEVSLITALVAGAVLLNVFKEEIPADRDSSFGWFAAGTVVFAALLAAATQLSA